MYASIDIGTNTVLLLITKFQGGKGRIIHEEQRMSRLGKGVDFAHNLHPESIIKASQAIKEYKELLEKQFPEVTEVTVIATSAVRDARNKSQFISKIKEETGFEVRVLTGFEEAEYTYLGAINALPEINWALVIDIGGGSTEVAFGENGTLLDSYSFDMGSVRFTERYLKYDPLLPREQYEFTKSVKSMLESRIFRFNSDAESPKLIGVSGTVTSLAFMDSELEKYNPEAINGYVLSIDKIVSWIDTLSQMTAREIESKYKEVMKGRADIIIGGLLILKEFMDFYSLTEITVSTGDIRLGAIIKRLV